jgi:eukaryotic-like serine/threonine-protein kinase
VPQSDELEIALILISAQGKALRNGARLRQVGSPHGHGNCYDRAAFLMKTLGPGSEIANAYRIVRRIAAGAMGTVFESVVIASGERVAIKIPHDSLRADPSAPTRLLREARMTVAIRSPHVVRTLAVGRLPSRMPFLVMELIDGDTLADLMNATPGKPLSVPEALTLTDQIASGLAATHHEGVVHRDLKPGNVFVQHEHGAAHARIFDFGLSLGPSSSAGRLTLSGVTFGTPQYMAPEQIRDARKVDARTDLYSLGVMAYEMLCARWPFSGTTAEEIWNDIMHHDPIPLSKRRPDLPPGLCRLVMRSMARAPDGRFASAEELRAALAPWRPRG